MFDNLLRPEHLLLILLFALFLFLAFGPWIMRRTRRSGFIYRQGRQRAAAAMAPWLAGRARAVADSRGAPGEKFCSECGKQIPRTAQVCPLCGCRQAATPAAV